MTDTVLRKLPSIDSLLRREKVAMLSDAHGRTYIRNQLRLVLDELRKEIGTKPLSSGSASSISVEIELRLTEIISGRTKERIGRVINATGVVIHTNLGRARLGQAAVDALLSVASNYCNLEYNIEEGTRGERAVALEQMLCDLFQCEAAAVVNNCAAAVLIILNTLAEGADVIVSRGELIEIGGSFRIPDVIAKSGARIREVGTTNRTRLSDYRNAISNETRVILRAHPSNYRIVGFTETPSLESLCSLAREHDISLVEDLGSGCVRSLSDCGIDDEPTIRASLQAGASLVAFSGDKLFGGPQAGIILGEAALVSRVKKNPLFRALRIDKLTAAALEATVNCYLTNRELTELPTLASIHVDAKEIGKRARQFKRRAAGVAPHVQLDLINGFSVVGGGSAPTAQLPTTLLRAECASLSSNEVDARLRQSHPPVIARILDDQLVLDLRTVTRDEEGELLRALSTLTPADRTEDQASSKAASPAS